MPTVMTAEELERLDMPGKSTELIRGHLVVREPHVAIDGSLNGEDALPGFSCTLRDVLN